MGPFGSKDESMLNVVQPNLSVELFVIFASHCSRLQSLVSDRLPCLGVPWDSIGSSPGSSTRPSLTPRDGKEGEELEGEERQSKEEKESLYFLCK